MPCDLVSVSQSVAFPPVFSKEGTWRVLRSCLLVRSDQHPFIQTPPRLLSLLAQRRATYDYAYVIRFVKARAAWLLLDPSHFSFEHVAMLTALGRRRIQFVWIYCELLIEAVREVVNTLSRVPGMPADVEDVIASVLPMVDARYLEVIQVTCLAERPGEMIHGRETETWGTGTRAVGDGKRESLIPCPVTVPVKVELVGRYRNVWACGQTMIDKIRLHDPIFVYCERVGEAEMADLELERLSRLPKVPGFWTLRYERWDIQFFKTLTNEKKDVLYAVCADRTMRIQQANGVLPGSIPRAIASAASGCPHQAHFLVRFDNGLIGQFTISFRAHKGNEDKWVPDGFWELPGCAAAGRAGARSEGPLLLTAGGHGAETGGDAEAPCKPAEDAGAAEATGGGSEGTAAGGETTSAVAGTRGTADDVRAQSAAGGEGEDAAPRISVIGDFRAIRVGKRVWKLTRRRKLRAFLRFVCKHLEKEKTRELYVEELREKFNDEIPEAKKRSRWVSDRFREDLFRGLERLFDLLFETLDKEAGHYRLKL